MVDTRFRSYSTGLRILSAIEFAICSISLVLVYEAEQRVGWVSQTPIAANLLGIYAFTYSLIVQLFVLALGLNNPKLRENFRAIFRRITIAHAMAGFTFGTITLITIGPTVVTQVMVATVIASILASTGVRYLDYNVEYLGRKINVLVLGSGKRATIIEQRMKRRVDRQRFNLHGFVTMRGDSERGIQSEKKLTLEGASLISFIHENNIDEIVIACDERRHNLPLDILFDCKIRGTEIIEILDFIEREMGQVAVSLVYPSWVIYSNGFASTHYLRNTFDWAFNGILAFLLGIVSLPAVLATYFAIKIEDGIRAPTLFFQDRIGLGGEVFRIVKFRSMAVDAEKDGPTWAKVNDNRVTTVGKIIRKYRIDELPQLYNVIRGEMGFVGPRPERPTFVKELALTIPYYHQRHNVKPGLTGWAQLKYPYGSTNEDALEKLKYDLYYVKHRSFLLDLQILIQTLEIVLFGKGR